MSKCGTERPTHSSRMEYGALKSGYFLVGGHPMGVICPTGVALNMRIGSSTNQCRSSSHRGRATASSVRLPQNWHWVAKSNYALPARSDSRDPNRATDRYSLTLYISACSPRTFVLRVQLPGGPSVFHRFKLVPCVYIHAMLMTQVACLEALKRTGWRSTRELGRGSFGVAIHAVRGVTDCLSMSMSMMLLDSRVFCQTKHDSSAAKTGN